MYVIFDIAAISLFTLSFMGIYFLYEKTMSLTSKVFINFTKYVMQTLNGLFLGGTTILLYILLLSFDNNFSIPLFFIVGLIVLILKNEYISTISSSIPLLYYLFKFEINSSIWYLVIVFFSIQFIYILVGYFFDKKIANLSIYISLFVFSIIGLILMGLVFEKSFNRFTIESSILLIIAFWLVYYPLAFGINLSISANVLFESTNYVFSKYVRFSLSESFIGHKIQTDKIKYGIYGIFTLVTNHKRGITNEIRDSILTIFENSVPKETTLFSYEKNTYGFFIPKNTKMELNKKYIFKEINNYINKIKKKFINIDGDIFNVNSYAAISLYGIQENTISKLHSNSVFEINNMNFKKQQVSLFDYKKYRKKLTESYDGQLLDEKINLEAFSNKIIKLYSYKTFKKVGNFVYIDNKDYSITESLEKLLRLNNWKIIFNKFFALNAINKFKNSEELFYIEYSPFILEEDFDLEHFENKLNKLNFDNSKIIWYFSYEDMIEKNKLEYVVNILSKKYKIALTEFEKAKIKDLKLLNPYALINNSRITRSLYKFKDFNIINTKINDYEIFQKSNLTYTNIVGGLLLNDYFYLESIKKKVKLNKSTKEK